MTLSEQQGAPNSTYVRTTIRIRNTYIHTYLSEAKPLDFGVCDFAESMHTRSHRSYVYKGWC